MENNVNTIENDQLQDVHKQNLVRREKIGKTFGSGFMRTIAILLTVFVSLDLFAGFVSTTTCDSSIFIQSVSWMALVVTRFVPNIIGCIAIWAIFSTAHGKHEINLLGFKTLRCVIIVMGIVVVLHLIGGIIMLVVNINYVIPIESLSVIGTVTLSIVIFTIFELIQLLIYILVFVSIDSVIKNKNGEEPMKLGKLTSITLIIVGSLMVLNFVPIINIINEIVEAFELRGVVIYRIISFIYQNPFSVILGGIIMIFGGIVILLFNNSKQIEK